MEKWGDWNSPTMLNMLLRATQKAQRLMAYKKKKNNLEEQNRVSLKMPNLLSEGSQDSIYEQHVKRPQVWQYRLWSFQAGGTKLERFLPKKQNTQRKLLSFENWVNGEVSKIEHHFSM